jgi:hypothetical protein
LLLTYCVFKGDFCEISLICIVLGQAGVNASKQKFVQNANGSAVGAAKQNRS